MKLFGAYGWTRTTDVNSQGRTALQAVAFATQPRMQILVQRGGFEPP